MVFEALADHRRRELCAYLASKSDTVEITAILSHFEQRQSTTPDGGHPRARFKIELHHVHLPLLDDADIVEYTPQSKQISPDRHFDVAEALLETTTEQELIAR
ncbi:DUF7344 domain-containing protein [Natronolimnobius baerhuensis]|nr:hypothetical protein [Natronolimnobius baerhuensis]